MRPLRKLKELSCYLLIALSFTTFIIYSSYSEPHINKSKTKATSFLPILSENNKRHSKARAHCNAPANIHLGHEGDVPSQYTLIGIAALMRHGDRGPLESVPNISSINCGYKTVDTDPYRTYVADMANISRTPSFLQAIQSFIDHPVLPPPNTCVQGQLTSMGVAQHLKLGRLLKSVYVDRYSLLRYPWISDEIELYSTKFRRTFQSSLAFVYSFLPSVDFTLVKWREGKHATFCGSYCSCSKTAFYEKQHSNEVLEDRKSHTGVVDLIRDISNILHQDSMSKLFTNPYVMRDALLTYACHGSNLPCDFKKCIELEDLSKLLAFEEWQARQRQTLNQLKAAKLRSYGILMKIMNSFHKMITTGYPKVMLYFGHDLTINNLLTGLGLPYFQIPHYASRVIFEVYVDSITQVWSSKSKGNFLFRLLYNGRDLTKLLPFCQSKLRKIPSETGKKPSTTLCGLENFFEYLNPKSYFSHFNTTSFQAACENG